LWAALFSLAQICTALNREGNTTAGARPCPGGVQAKEKGLLKNEQTQLQNHSFLKNSAQIARKTAF
jgi:hypothetical protein